MGKKALTETDIAALAAGLDIEAAADPVVEGDESTTEAAAAVEDAAVETAAEVTETEEGKHESQASVVSFLQAQLKDKDTEIVNLSIEVKGLKDKVDSMEATHTGLTEVVRKAVAGMKVRMGASNVDLSALSAQELLADYAATSEAFLKTFKAGGVAAVDAASGNSEKNEPAATDSVTSARLAAVRFSTKRG